jgi:glycerate kinase
MNIVIAPDSFKECLSATQVANAISEGIKQAFPEAEISCIPIADGGEGTVNALVAATGGKLISAPTVDALNRPIQSFFGVLGDGKTAVIEMAAASGIELLAPEERNPLITSTFGTGLLLKTAMEAGFTEIILGIGGSATNDGGAGMAQAVGFRLLDGNGNPIGLGGGCLGELRRIDGSNAHPMLRKVKIRVACDVQNPLLGPSGASRVFGPQKGATPEMVEILEKNMAHFAQILIQELELNLASIPGAGAAGGLGAGLMAFCKAKTTSGFDLVSKLTHLEEKIKKASIAFTGEGKIDRQTAFGKTISGVAKLGKKHQVPVIAFAGIAADDLTELYNLGVTSVFTISEKPITIEESKNRAAELLANTAERVARLYFTKSQ